MLDCTKNLYEILDISPRATGDEIKRAYKKLVRIYHPDLNKSKGAETAFKLLNNAYDILSDKVKKSNYDSLLNISKPKKWVEPKEDAIVKEVKITETEVKEGAIRTVNILNKQKCPKCMGKKIANGTKCGFCLGKGEKSEHKKIDVFIEKETKDGEIIYVGKINSSALYDKKLFLKVLVEPARRPRSIGSEIVVDVEIPIYDAVLGTKMEINIEGTGLVSFIVPSLCKPGSKIALFGSYYALIDVIFPKTLSNEEKNLYNKIRTVNLNDK